MTATRHETGPYATVQRYCDARNRLEGYPRKGKHVGGGRHVDIPDAPPGPGWSLYSPRKHPTRDDEFECPAAAPAQWAVEFTRLSSDDKATIRDGWQHGKPLAADWIVAEPGEPVEPVKPKPAPIVGGHGV